MRTEDGYIIHKCLNGEPEAFGLLVEKYKVGVYAFVLAKLNSFHDAQDIAQDVFIKAYYNLHKLKRYDSFASWLYRIALNSCKNKLKAASKRPDREFIEDYNQETLDKPSIESYHDEMLCESVREALDSLPETYKQVLAMHYIGGMTSEEIAKTLYISPANVRYRLSRAREQLKEEVLTTMNADYEQHKLPVSFTIHIVEAVKRIRVNPISTAKGLPWGISLIAGIMFGILSLAPGIKPPDLMPAPMSSPLPERSSIMPKGEFPIKLLMGPEMSMLSGRRGDGRGGGADRPVQQKGLSLAPKGEEEYTFVRSWPEEILGLRNPRGVVVDSSGNVYVTDTGNNRIQKFNSNGDLLMKWGTYGSGDGQFNYPSGITIDSAGNVYVADGWNHCIQKFDSSGDFLMKWGSEGSGDGQFNCPYGITIDSAGNVYVTDHINCRIQKFDSEGKFLAKWGVEGSGDGQFKWPQGIAVDSAGNAYVVDYGNYRIQKFDSEGRFLMRWGDQGFGDGQFFLTYGITTDSARNVYVTDTGSHRVQKFDSDGKFLAKLGNEGNNNGQFQGPAGVAIDSFGDVYVVDCNNNRVQKFDSKGRYLTKWGGWGQGDGQFNCPYGITIDSDGDVYVVDKDNNRIQKFDSNGKYLEKWGSEGRDNGQFWYPYDIAIDGSGNVYVSDSYFRIQKFNSRGEFLLKWGTQGAGNRQFQWAISVEVDSSGNVYVVDCTNNRVQKFDSKGNFLMKWGEQGTGEGEFNWPISVATDSAGNIYVAENNHRIQKFNSEGKFLAKWGTYGVGDMELNCPTGIAVSSSGDIYVADSNNHRIKVYRQIGGGTVEPANKQPTTWARVKQTELYQNYPNPFNPETWIPYQLGEDTRVEIKIYASSGKLVRTLNPGRKQAGSYISKEKAAYWDGRNEAGERVSSGIYFYTIKAGDYSDTKKMILIE